MAEAFKQSMIFNLVLFLIGAILICIWYNNVNLEGFASPATPDIDSSPKRVNCFRQYYFDLYYADWCKFTPIVLPEFKSLGPTLTIGDKVIACTAYDFDKYKKKHTMKGWFGDSKWKEFRGNNLTNPILGFPTMRLYSPSGGFLAEYEGARTAVAMKAWLAEVVNRPTGVRKLLGCGEPEEDN